jgi:two-component system, OmpR family, phosphate regulon response regulator PhoB
MFMKPRILIIEDEPDLVELLEYNLRKNEYEVSSALNGADAFNIMAKGSLPDLVLLDLMLPDTTGTEICLKIRAEQRTRNLPVIMLTAKSEEIDRIVGFEVGADDYVTKPFSVRELLLRIRAVLRRNTTTETSADKISFAELTIDVPAHRVTVSNDDVPLTALEFDLLNTLVLRKGRVQTREMLLTDVWEMNADVTTRTVDTHVKRLREKLGPAARYIETIRGVGYRFRATPPE